MFKNFNEIEEFVLQNEFKATVALIGSHDDDALASIVNARKKGIVKAVLIGDESKTKEMLRKMGESLADYEYINEPDNAKAARTACRLIKDKKADIPMKGLIPTATFMKAILDKEDGFVPPNGLISVAFVAASEKEGRIIIFTDVAINIEPDYAAKLKIIENSVRLARQMGIACPKVSAVAPVEVINPAMQSTIDAAMLSKAAQRGQIKNCVIDGPLGMDNALSAEAAKHKGIESPVAGCSDIFLMPDLASGNILTKGLQYFGDGLETAGVAVGTTVAVIMTSRSDTAKNKYNSILIGALQTIKSKQE